MTSNNETVSRQNLWAGNIAKPLTSEGNSALLSARADRSHTEKVFFVGFIPNHFKTGHDVNSSLCFPSWPVIKYWIYRGYYIAARGYEFYLRVLKVSLTSERSERYFQHEKIKFVSSSGHVMFCLFYRYWWKSYIKHNFYLFIFATAK